MTTDRYLALRIESGRTQKFVFVDSSELRALLTERDALVALAWRILAWGEEPGSDEYFEVIAGELRARLAPPGATP